MITTALILPAGAALSAVSEKLNGVTPGHDQLDDTRSHVTVTGYILHYSVTLETEYSW